MNDLLEFGADGIYGAETARAVEQFQRDSGMNEAQTDGIVGVRPEDLFPVDGDLEQSVDVADGAALCGSQQDH